MLKKASVKKCTNRLDKIANEVQNNWQDLGLTKKAAFNFCLKVDQISDHLEKMAGLDPISDVLEMEDDEPYMENYETGGAAPGDREDDEPYMDHYLDDTSDEFGSPMEGETSEELQGRKDAWDDDWDDFDQDVDVESSWYGQDEDTNWYDKEASNWYEEGKGSNWYDG